MSGDSEQEYFSDGITEDLITELSRFRALSVISRNSSFVFKGRAEPIKDVSKKLGAQFIVEGSVRRAGDRVRITAQLIDASSDNHIWAERYERGVKDIFAVQDDVVRRVAGTLVGRLEEQWQERSELDDSRKLEAYDLYLRGREHFFNWSQQDNKQAQDYLTQALELEPRNAPVLALLSEVMLRMWLNGWSEDPAADLEMALRFAKKADEIDDQDSRTQTALAMAYLFHRKLDKAAHHFEAATSLNPNDTRALAYSSRHAVLSGDVDRAIDLVKQASSLNPYGKYNWNSGLVYFVGRRYSEAISLLQAIRNPPEAVLALLAASYAMAGEVENASETTRQFIDAATRCPAMSALSGPKDWRSYFEARWPFRNAEDLDHLMVAFEKAGLPIR